MTHTKSANIVPNNIIQSSENASPGRERHLDKIDRGRRDRDGDTKPDQESPAHKLSQAGRGRLQNGAEDDEARAREHAEAAPVQVAGRGGEEGADNATDGVDGEDDADGAALHANVEERVEGRHGIDGAHERAVEAVHAVV